MGVYGFGNGIEISGTGYGYAEVTVDNSSFLVKCIEFTKDNTINYENVGLVVEACQKLIRSEKRKININDLKEYLSQYFSVEI